MGRSKMIIIFILILTSIILLLHINSRCPRCGSRTHIIDDTYMVDGRMGRYYSKRCSCCYISSVIRKTPEEAKKAWNRGDYWRFNDGSFTYDVPGNIFFRLKRILKNIMRNNNDQTT